MPKDANGSFNAEMLQVARFANGLSQDELARAVGVNQNTLSRWEAGLRTPGDHEVDELAKALDRPVDFFYREAAIERLGDSVVFHRKRAATRKMVIRQVHARVAIAKMAMQRLLSHLEPVDVFFDPPDSRDPRSPEEVSQSLRKAWKVRPGPIRNLVGLIEAAGCLVIPFDFGTFDIDAIGIWPGNCQPLIFANMTVPTDRLRFSLAHELGHLVLHTKDDEFVEDEADRFAGELLLPTKSVKTELLDLNASRIWLLKERWRVSGQCILYRARQCGVLNEGRYRSLMAYFSKRGWRRREPVDIVPEAPSVIGQVADIFCNQLSYSVEEVQALTGCTPNELSEWFGMRQQLRLAHPSPRLRHAK